MEAEIGQLLVSIIAPWIDTAVQDKRRKVKA